MTSSQLPVPIPVPRTHPRQPVGSVSRSKSGRSPLPKLSNPACLFTPQPTDQRSDTQADTANALNHGSRHLPRGKLSAKTCVGNPLRTFDRGFVQPGNADNPE